MAVPQLITVTGKYTKTDGTPESGTVTFQMSGFVQSAADNEVISPGKFVGTLDADGVLSVQVFATDDPLWVPDTWTYHVIVKLSSARAVFWMEIPLDTPGQTIDIADLLPTVEKVGTSYAPLNHTHEGQGGGGGGTPSNTVVSGTSFGASSTAGAASSYSRGDHSHGTPAAPTPAGIGAATAAHNHSGVYDPVNSASGAITAHVGVPDPHTQYALETDVSTALTGKSNTGHTHAIADTSGLQAALDGKQPSGSYAAASHTHTTSQISDSTTTGRAVLAAVDAAAARTAIGAGTSSLALGSSGSTAAAGNHTHTAADVGLGNVDNTSDASKPVSTAQQAALNLKAPLASPTFTGTPTAPTQTAGDNSTKIATTAYVATAVGGGGGGTAPTFVRQRIATGNVAFANDASFAVVSGFSIAIPAAIGDDIQLDINCLVNQGAATDFLDLAVIVGGVPVRCSSSDTNTPLLEGDPAMYPLSGSGIRGIHNSFSFTAASGDISGGNITFGILHKGPGGGTPKIYADANYSFRWSVRNDH